jgi:hypothetical protein
MIEKKLKTLLIISILFVFQSCGKNVSEVKPEFIGYWLGSDDVKSYVIRIKEDGFGRYSYVGNGEMGNSEGTTRYSNGKLRFGALKGLVVNKEPTFNGNEWEMIVDDILYIRSN